MQIDTIDGSDWCFDGRLYIGKAFHTAVSMRGTDEDACIFITDGTSDEEPPDLNVFFHIEESDMDSTDVNPFRQYGRPVKNLLSDITAIEGLSVLFTGKSMAYIDRELVRTFGFTRII